MHQTQKYDEYMQDNMKLQLKPLTKHIRIADYYGRSEV